MTPRELKQTANRQQVLARIVSDGCRDYVVELLSENGAGLLRHRRGKTLRFRNLREVQKVLKRCGVQRSVLRQRVADDEACGGSTSFHDLPLAGHH